MAQGQDAKVAIEKGHATLARRSLFELAGLTIATMALPDDLAMAMQSASTDKAAQGVSPVMEKLSTYMSEASGRALPEEVVEKAKHHVLDTFAAMISGSELPPGGAAIQFARAYGGKEVATVVRTECLLIPTRRTTRTARRARIRAFPWFPRRWPPASSLESAGRISCAP